MGQNHLFVMDPLDSLNLPLDSSLRMMNALANQGERVFSCQPGDLARLTGRGSGIVMAQELRFKPEGWQPGEPTIAEPQRLPLADFAAVHMRKDPPYDVDYVATTWLMDGAPGHTKHYNQAEALRAFNEKLVIMDFPEDSAPCIATANWRLLREFFHDGAGGDAILKPVTLFGGRGVIRLEQSKFDDAALTKLLKKETQDGREMRLMQPFDTRVTDGEVRVFTAFGEPLGWCLKKPAPGEFLANTRAGATLEAYSAPREVEERVRRVATELRSSGIELIGFDIIGGLISEINITSPRMLLPPGESDQAPYERFAALVKADVGS